MPQTMQARNTLRLAHSLPTRHRPIPHRPAIVLAGLVLVPVMVLVIELLRDWAS